MMIRGIPLPCFFALLCGGGGGAQSRHYDWKQWSWVDFNKHLTYTLEDAPLSNSERRQIYRLIDKDYVHGSFTDAQRDDERDTVMNARVGSITLGDDGSQQVLVEGPTLICGASGGCPYWIFIRDHGRLRLVLAAIASSILVQKTGSHRFPDVAAILNWGAFDGEDRVYTWNGLEYEQADCFTSKANRDNPAKPPVIEPCAERPQPR